MPKLHYKEQINNFCSIGVQLNEYHSEKADITKYGKWSARIKFPNRKVLLRTTGVSYDGGSATNKMEAARIAEKLTMELYQKSLTNEVSQDTTLRMITHDFLEEIEKYSEANDARIKDGLLPTYEVSGGKGYWSVKRWKTTSAIVRDYLLPFYKEIHTKNRDGEADIVVVPPQDLDKLRDFVFQNPTKKLIIATRI